jgi:hypothetical protein
MRVMPEATLSNLQPVPHSVAIIANGRYMTTRRRWFLILLV